MCEECESGGIMLEASSRFDDRVEGPDCKTVQRT